MTTKIEYDYSPEGISVNPYNKALPPRGLRIDKAEMKVPTGCNVKKFTATSLCLRNCEALDKCIVQMVQECDALAALLLCLLTPIIGTCGASMPKWNKVEHNYNDLLSSANESGECNPTLTEIQESFRTKNICGLVAKAIYQVKRYIRPPVFDEEDEPLSGTKMQFSHFYYGMERQQAYVVFRFLSCIKHDANREGAHWLDWKRPEGKGKKAKKTKRLESCGQLRANLIDYAKKQGAHRNLIAEAHTAASPADGAQDSDSSQPNTQTFAPKLDRGVVILRSKTTNGKRALRALLGRAKNHGRQVYGSQPSSGVRDPATDHNSALSSTETLGRAPEDDGKQQERPQDNVQPADQEGANPLRPQMRRKKEKHAAVPVNVFHPVMGFTRFLPILRTWHEPGLEELQDAFDKVEGSGVPRLAQNSQAARSPRKRDVNGDGMDAVLEIQKFFYKLCDRLKIWLTYSRAAGQMDEHQRVAQEMVEFYDKYTKVHAET